MKRIAWLLLTIGFGFASNGYAQVSAPTGPGGLKDPMQLCAKLDGTERENCLRQAQQGRAAGGIGATPGAGSGGIRAPGAPAAKSEDNKRGNTPPGSSRGGDAPASGAIVDPAGVTKR